jgi:hypothetical protein
MDSTLVPTAQGAQAAGGMLTANGALTPGATGTASNGQSAASGNGMISGVNYGDTNYDFFDPQHWMLDGLLDFNYNFVQPLEGA